MHTNTHAIFNRRLRTNTLYMDVYLFCLNLLVLVMTLCFNENGGTWCFAFLCVVDWMDSVLQLRIISTEDTNSSDRRAIAQSGARGGGGNTARGGIGRPASARKLRCNSCDVDFSDTKEHREHFKADWHRVNLKRKVDGLPAVTQEEYEADPLLLLDERSNDLGDYCK